MKKKFNYHVFENNKDNTKYICKYCKKERIITNEEKNELLDMAFELAFKQYEKNHGVNPMKFKQ